MCLHRTFSSMPIWTAEKRQLRWLQRKPAEGCKARKRACDSKSYVLFTTLHVRIYMGLTKMSSESWPSLTDSPFNCCCNCPTAWGRSRAGINQSWSSSSSISWKQRSRKSCSCSSSSTWQVKESCWDVLLHPSQGFPQSFPSAVITLQLRMILHKA